MFFFLFIFFFEKDNLLKSLNIIINEANVNSINEKKKKIV